MSTSQTLQSNTGYNTISEGANFSCSNRKACIEDAVSYNVAYEYVVVITSFARRADRYYEISFGLNQARLYVYMHAS